ncbi:MAG: chemotaxis protein CheA, partial [Chthoniobacterales bacterium]|nr:chemotaxis protein CheA [Chthoniobacterales bacterium]
NIRMMPVGTTFQKYHRLVRDLCRELGKEAVLVIEGGETELDKTVLDQLGDPLTHILRNSVDHGLEKPEERIAVGKPASGTIRLAAEHRGERVVIRISDDGQGLNTEKIRQKAIERGLISAEARLAEQEIWGLIFEPGFSTAQKVTGISGRGVGMDVVKKKIQGLGGEVSLQSERGKGTEILLSLPLTLAIIDGLMVEVDGDRLIIPLSIVSETIELRREERFRHNARNVVDLRGHPIPYLRLRELFGYGDGGAAIEPIVIVEHQGQRIGLVVDRVIGNHQTVLKSLGRLCRNVAFFSGATILGDGTVALVLDVGGILRVHRSSIDPRTTLEV